MRNAGKCGEIQSLFSPTRTCRNVKSVFLDCGTNGAGVRRFVFWVQFARKISTLLQQFIPCLHGTMLRYISCQSRLNATPIVFRRAPALGLFEPSRTSKLFGLRLKARWGFWLAMARKPTIKQPPRKPRMCENEPAAVAVHVVLDYVPKPLGCHSLSSVEMQEVHARTTTLFELAVE